MRRIPLSLMQQRFSELIRTRTHASSDAADIGILNQHPISVEERLAIYQNAFRIRMSEALEEDFPDTLAILGGARFTALVEDYISQLPSRFWSLAQLGERLPGFIEGSGLGAELPFLSDLARLEWARVLSGLAAIAEPFDFSKLSKFSSDAQQNLVLELAPSVQLFESPWAVNPVLEKRRVEKKTTRLVVFQKDAETQHLELSEAQWSLIAKINDGKPIADLIRTSKSLTENQLTAWFSEWVASGIIARIKQEGISHEDR